MYIEKMLESLGLDTETFDVRDNTHRSHNLVPDKNKTITPSIKCDCYEEISNE